MSPAVYWYALQSSTLNVEVSTGVATSNPSVRSNDATFLFGLALGLMYGILAARLLRKRTRKRK